MNRIYIVLVSVDYTNAKEVCNAMQNKDFSTTKEIFDSFKEKLESDEEIIGGLNTLSLNEFILLCNENNNELENHFICYVTKNVNLTNKEIYLQWEKDVKFDAKMIGDLGDFNCLIVELPNKDYRIGYDEENDQFYFSKYENDEETIIAYSNNQNNLEVWERLIEVENQQIKNNK